MAQLSFLGWYLLSIATFGLSAIFYSNGYNPDSAEATAQNHRPALLFVGTVILCGCLEYFSSWYLEITHDGQRWWDYTGYFLNLNGRICAEGLLTFGLGGLAIAYLLAPVLDNLLARANRRIMFIVAIVLLVAYVGDNIYSSIVPNTGAGITDYKEPGSSVESQRSISVDGPGNLMHTI